MDVLILVPWKQLLLLQFAKTAVLFLVIDVD